MSVAGYQPATPEDKVVHCAVKWRETEKLAISAPAEKKPAAQRANQHAKLLMREAIDLLLRRKS